MELLSSYFSTSSRKNSDPMSLSRFFFDLIVGTRYVPFVHQCSSQITDTKITGGIIALGLGVKRWSVEECIRRFKELCRPAFRHLELLAYKIWYETKPLESALQSALGDRLVFDGPTSDGPTNIRVAVTSMTASENQPRHSGKL